MTCPWKDWLGNAFAAIRPTSKPTARWSIPGRRPNLFLVRPHIAGGCDVGARPSLSATMQEVLWSPRANPGVIVLAPLPTVLRHSPPVSISAIGDAGDHPNTHDPTSAGQVLPLLLLPGIEPGAPVAALIPLDDDIPGRIEALNRLWQARQGKRVPPDTRMTAQRRRRIRLMMQASDGRARGANYRVIAEVLFGEERVDTYSWKTSPLRDQVIGLVEGGTGLIAGGYLRLFRHRRRA